MMALAALAARPTSAPLPVGDRARAASTAAGPGGPERRRHGRRRPRRRAPRTRRRSSAPPRAGRTADGAARDEIAAVRPTHVRGPRRGRAAGGRIASSRPEERGDGPSAPLSPRPTRHAATAARSAAVRLRGGAPGARRHAAERLRGVACPHAAAGQHQLPRLNVLPRRAGRGAGAGGRGGARAAGHPRGARPAAGRARASVLAALRARHAWREAGEEVGDDLTKAEASERGRGAPVRDGVRGPARHREPPVAAAGDRGLAGPASRRRAAAGGRAAGRGAGGTRAARGRRASSSRKGRRSRPATTVAPAPPATSLPHRPQRWQEAAGAAQRVRTVGDAHARPDQPGLAGDAPVRRRDARARRPSCAA